MFQIGFPQSPIVADMGLRVIGRFPLSINLLMRFVLLSRPASFCGSSSRLAARKFCIPGWASGFPAAASRTSSGGILGSFTMICSPPCKLGRLRRGRFPLGLSVLGRRSSCGSGCFKAFCFLWREWLACVLCGGKLFQRPGLGRLCAF